MKLFEQIVKKALEFKEVRLNSFGHYPIYLTYESFIHMGLRHISEWRFNDFYNRKAVFQLNEKDIIPTLRRVIDEINEEYQGIKAERPDYLFRRFGKNSIYLNGDYYMIHIASDGSVENFAKTIDKSRD